MTSWRIALPAVALLGCALLASGPVRAADARTSWTDLWQTPDQQGQALLKAGEPARAAGRFHDPRRRAYADLETGDYRQAAQLLAPFTDAESEYNRGNALARSGQLQAALAAYEAALKQAPADADIRHNRDLVEQALRRTPQRSQSSANGKQNGRQSGSSGGQKPSSGQQSGSGAQQSGGEQSNREQSPGNSQQAGNSQQSSHSPPAADNSQPGARGAQSNRAADSSQQAKRDAAMAAALAHRQQQTGRPGNSSQPQSSGRRDSPSSTSRGGGDSDSRDLVAGGTRTPPQKPETEKQLALDQWLRQIPDSPAGLLRRKFLIEHMMKEQASGNPEGSE